MNRRVVCMAGCLELRLQQVVLRIYQNSISQTRFSVSSTQSRDMDLDP